MKVFLRLCHGLQVSSSSGERVTGLASTNRVGFFKHNKPLQTAVGGACSPNLGFVYLQKDNAER